MVNNQCYKYIHYMLPIITNKDIDDIATHRIIPAKNGLMPTDFRFALDNPAPIRNKVSVSPFLANSTIHPNISCAIFSSEGTNELISMATTKNQIK